MDKIVVVRYLLQLLVTLILVDVIATNTLDVSATLSDNGTTFNGEGKFDSKSNRGYAKFFGIRYAQPPVGNKRFQKPAFYQYPQKTVDAKKHGNVCPQRRKDNSLVDAKDVIGEDCLFLNIIVPLDSEVHDVSTIAKKKAVYIFIHGGVFLRGSSNMFVMTQFVMGGDFVSVTINYRLGILGFLTTDDAEMPANLGLWDQRLAIQWVKQNIGAFGGDPSRITVGGQSAGSMSAILQSFYKGNDYLFQNTIAESGTPFASRVVSEKGRPLALKIAKMAGCDVSSKKVSELSKTVVKCLRAKSTKELVDLPDTKEQISPVFDNDFIDQETFKLCPSDLPRLVHPKSVSSAFGRKNFLSGFTTNDGEIVFALALDKLRNALAIENRAAFVGAPISLGVLRILLKDQMFTNKTEDVKTKNAAVDAILQKYVDWTNSSDKKAISMSAVDIMTDNFFISPAINTALLHSQANQCRGVKTSNCGKMVKSTYMYEFRYPIPSLLAVTGDFPWFRGSRHGAEIFLLLDYDAFEKEYPRLTAKLRNTWSNFINTGNPNKKGQDEWTEFNEKTQDIFLLTNESKITSGTHTNKIHFWTKYLPKLKDQFNAALEKGTMKPPKKPDCPTVAKNVKDDDDTAGVGQSAGKMVPLFFAFVVVALLKL